MSIVQGVIGREKMPDARFERQIVTGIIVSTEFLKGVYPIYREGCLRIPFARTIAIWVLEYFEKYQVSPGKQIEEIFRDKKDSISDLDEIEMIESFLTDISNEYVKGETFNAGYLLDKTENHFRELSLKNLTNEIKKSLIGGRIEEAEALVKGYNRVTRIQTKGVDPITDTKIIASALDDTSGDKLFSLPGVLGETIGPLERGWLFSFVGSSGTGKTWWLMLTALRALFAGYNVVFVSMEMSEKQMTRRIQHWINALPSRKWAGELLIPVFDCLKNQSGFCNKSTRTNSISFKDKKKYLPCVECMNTPEYDLATWFKTITKEELTISHAIEKSRAIKRSALLRGNSFKLVTYPSRTATIQDIKVYLHNLENYEDFIPDVIVTDYADKVRPSDSRQQWRHQLAEIWEGHKSLAQEKNCLVVTASQSNTARTGKDIKQGDWAESISKLELSDAGMSINMTAEDKEQGIMRATVMKQRHDDFNLIQEVMVLHALKIGRPYLSSYLMPKKKKDEKEESK